MRTNRSTANDPLCGVEGAGSVSSMPAFLPPFRVVFGPDQGLLLPGSRPIVGARVTPEAGKIYQGGR